MKKYTKGKWFIEMNPSGEIFIDTDINISIWPIAKIVNAPFNSPENKEEEKANAIHICKCVNEYNEIVDTLKEVNDYFNIITDPYNPKQTKYTEKELFQLINNILNNIQ